MSHQHTHHHHQGKPDKINTAFVLGIALNLFFVIIQIVAGLYIHSLALLSDAGHNFADVGGLVFSLVAFKMLKVKSTKKYTYGYKKTTVLTALVNSMILLVSVGAIFYEAIQRCMHPTSMPGLGIAAVATVGVCINLASALLFLKEKDHDINIKSAYLHLMADAAISISIVAGGIIIHYTHWYWLDSALSILVAITILAGTWSLLKESVRLSLDGVPAQINIDTLKHDALKVQGIKDVHHIHVWALSTTENALTAHLVFENGLSTDRIKVIKQDLKQDWSHLNIQHVTLETEYENENCVALQCY